MNWFKQNVVASERKRIEPGATFSLFENHWRQAEEVMKSSVDSDGALAVISHLSQMISFLSVTRGEPPSENSCKSFWLKNKCSDVVIQWLHSLQIKGLQLPLEDELKLVAMLHSLCEAASRDGELLGYLKSTSEDGSWDGAYSLASLLLEYSLRNDDVQLSETARYSFLMLIELASRFPGLEKSLAQESGQGLTNVVISGLSACFAQLPTFSEATPEQMQPFIEQIKFVDQVTHAASDKISPLISECFTNAFLLAVIEPALTQDDTEGRCSLQTQQDLSYVTSLNEEIAVVTFYLQIICQFVTHPLLVRNLFHFINSKLLKQLVHRINHVNQSVNVAVSSLSLLNVLLEFYCEDFWYEILLQHLLPQNHLMVAERNQKLPLIDFQESSVKFLNLIPSPVIQAVTESEMSEQYFHYLNQESEKWFDFNSAMGILPAVTRIALEQDLENYYSPKNSTFRFWKRKYNGTDNANEPGKVENGLHEDFLQNEREEEVEVEEKSDYSLSFEDPLSIEHVQPKFMTINLQNGDIEGKNSAETDKPRNDSYSFAAALDDSPTNSIASFGSFLDSIFVQLSNWPHLDLDVILMITRIVTTLASSRIPLINSLLLDSRITLQPYYITFHTLLKRIREDLEFQMKDIPPEVVKVTWEWLTGSTSTDSRRVSNGAVGILSVPFSSSSSFSEHLSESLLRKISSTTTSKAIANAFKMFQSPKNPNTRMTTSLSTNFVTSSEPYSGSGYSWHASRADTRKILDIAEPGRSMSIRVIIFAHWMMELGAVSQQTCWSSAF